ncbi:MAG: glycosyltransferase [Tissierellales bacterium]|nr:glycosyltransferase [Tissierellales bacterium]MBN2828263.1 glycosyltransferase [Tissierellales bacterium]
MEKGRIYTVHYGKDISVTLKFINSISEFLTSSLDLIIVNNSKDVCLNIKHDHIRVLSTPENLGYFGAINYAIEKFPIANIDFIIICNNDLEICDNAFFSILKNKLSKYDIIAPSIRTIEGKEQNPHRLNRPSRKRLLYYKLYYSSFIIAYLMTELIRFIKMKNKNPDTERKIFSPHGAFFILKSTYFKKGGNIDCGFFLYGEEDSIAAQADELCLSIGFVPQLKVKHWESFSTGKKFSLKKFEFQKTAHKYIKQKYPHFFSYD